MDPVFSIKPQDAAPSFVDYERGERTTRLKISSIADDRFAVKAIRIDSSGTGFVAFFQRIRVTFGDYVKVDSNIYLHVSDVSKRFLMTRQQILNSKDKLIEKLKDQALSLQEKLKSKEFQDATFHTQRLYKQAVLRNPEIFLQHFNDFLKIFNRYNTSSHKIIRAHDLADLVSEALEALDKTQSKKNTPVTIRNKKYAAIRIEGELHLFQLNGSQLGMGYYGTVHKVKNLAHANFKALKEPHSSEGDEFITQEETIHKFLKGVRGVQDPPTLIKIGKRLYTITKLYPHDLEKIAPSLSNKQRISCAHQLLTTLSDLLSRGIYHQDIKLANIFVDFDGGSITTKLGDWGVAVRTVGDHIEGPLIFNWKKGSKKDSIQKPFREAQEIISLGKVIVEMITGVDPFEIDVDIHEVNKMLVKWGKTNNQEVLTTLLVKMIKPNFSETATLSDVNTYLQNL